MGKIWKHMLAHPECPLDEIPLIPEKIRAPLKEEFVYCTSKLVKSVQSEIDGTIKMLIRLQDGGEVEAVLIHHSGEAEHPDQKQADRCGQRDTLCISSQVGCRLGCTFCATGTMGLQGNLWPGEIQEQLIHAKTLRQVSNVVFMGMGEPLENLEGVNGAINGMVDPQRFGLAPSGITVSTVGILHNMRRLMKEQPKVKLAVSLHAPNQELREQLLPIAKTFKMEQLMEVIDEYAATITNDGKRKGMVMVSYVLLEDVNDTLECARELRDLVIDRPVIVNLIPYNPFEGNVHNYRTPTADRVDAFLKVLVEAGIRVFERRHHGRDISAACGQLAKLGSSAPAADIENCSCLLSKEKMREADGTEDGSPVAVPARQRYGRRRRELAQRRLALGIAAAAGTVASLALLAWVRRRRGSC
eukprot:TRINITY_DN46751_c0_g1_i1.p1 TRINITY_DN46751_c0_g1~~TRINITY_DN46751_c0_g1_i1.p1  ORF type:complete len:469 (+),score=120.61 TRINITY_DN46751_c0_g1_i1:163-1407(+)